MEIPIAGGVAQLPGRPELLVIDPLLLPVIVVVAVTGAIAYYLSQRPDEATEDDRRRIEQLERRVEELESKVGEERGEE